MDTFLKTEDFEGVRLTCRVVMYRVSINSFPDYKHLVQENYVEYKCNFFQNVTQL